MNSNLGVPTVFEIRWCLELRIGLSAATFGSSSTGTGGGVYVCVEGVGFLWFGCVDHFAVS